MKTAQKGEFIFKEGDKVTNLILIQSGAVQLCISRPKKNLELATVGAGQIVGEQALLGGTYPFSALATVETKYAELPSEAYKAQVESSAQVLKVVLKSLTDRMKVALNEIRTFRQEKDSSPCPDDQVAKVFGSLFHAARHKGDKDPKEPNKCTIEWTLLKQYAQRVFGESPKRLEQALYILVKMKLARIQMGKPPESPDGPDEIQKVFIDDLHTVESFFEFFQYYYFKGGKTDLLKSDELATQLLTQLLKLAEGKEVDRFGVVRIEYSKVIEHFKNEMQINLNNDHFNRLEAKGVMSKRQADPQGVVWLSFEIKEFQTTTKIWKILKEIEKWNERGFVDPHEEEAKSKKKGSGPHCVACSADLPAQAKFCPECGHKVELTKAG